MQSRHRISLNAVRVFSIVARCGSLAAAGAELAVTPGAVSHQIRKLEEELGVRFFTRGNNSVALTEAGERFFREVAPAVALIERSAQALYRDEHEIGVDASMSLAVRWLIPALDRFRAIHPEARVRVDTGMAGGSPTIPICDVAIRYFREGERSDGWRHLGCDLSRPVVSPRLMEGREGRRADTSAIPALQCAADNWDWKLWCEKAGVPWTDLSLSYQFDTDDAAIHACVAGLGMVLAPPVLTARELRSGALIAVPGYPAAELGTYRYVRRSEARAVRQFCSWLDAEMRSFD